MVLNAESTALETRHLGFTISPHEECGVEEAVRLIEGSGGESVVLTLGPPDAIEQLRDAMALGIGRAIPRSRLARTPPRLCDAARPGEELFRAVRRFHR